MKILTKAIISFSLFTILWVSIEVLTANLVQPTLLMSLQNVIQEDSTLFWRQKANLQNVSLLETMISTNEEGFRAPVSKSPSIVFFGASPTFGLGVQGDENYPSYVHHCSPKYEVSNYGQIGFSSYQGRLLFDQKITGIRPKIAVISYLINDVGALRFFKNEDKNDRNLAHSEEIIVAIRNTIRHSNVYRYVQQIMEKSRKSEEIYHKEFISRVSIVDYKKNLAHMIKSLQKMNTTVILIAPPILSTEKTVENSNPITTMYNEVRKRHYIYRQAMSEVANEFKIRFVDFTPLFNDDQSLFVSSIHPSKEGHQLIANKICGLLTEKDELKDSK